jgi:hypothetical protein
MDGNASHQLKSNAKELAQYAATGRLGYFAALLHYQKQLLWPETTLRLFLSSVRFVLDSPFRS